MVCLGGLYSSAVQTLKGEKLVGDSICHVRQKKEQYVPRDGCVTDHGDRL